MNMKMKGAIFQMSQMPCKMRGSIYLHNAGRRCRMLKILQIPMPRKLCCLFLCCFGRAGFASFLFLALQSFTSFLTSWSCLCLPARRNQSHKRKEITNTAYTETKTTTSTISTVVGVFLQLHHPQQQPQQQWQQQQETTPTTIPAASATTDKDSKTNKNPQQT